MHYAFDAWMAREFPRVWFERDCDDVVVHCASKERARQIRDAISARLDDVGLELHPQKTKIVYCKDADRTGSHQHEKFTFLGYEFRPRLARNRHGRHFVSFLPAVSPEAMKAMGAEIRSWHWAKRSDKSLGDLALMFNSIVQGWVAAEPGHAARVPVPPALLVRRGGLQGAAHPAPRAATQPVDGLPAL